jgi:uncharacterized protein YqgV (UPF0045/DUF77 family)
MNISVDLSYYPLTENFIPPIREVIAALNAAPGLTVVGNTMSTQVFGPASIVFPLLEKLMQQSWTRDGRGVFVAKFIGGDTRELA